MSARSGSPSAAPVFSTSYQPISGCGARVTRPPGRRGEELAAEADPEDGEIAPQRVGDQVDLLADPGVVLHLVHVHRAPEDHERVVVVGRRRGRVPEREAPLVELVASLTRGVAEDPRMGVAAVDQREDAHPGESSCEQREG